MCRHLVFASISPHRLNKQCSTFRLCVKSHDVVYFGLHAELSGGDDINISEKYGGSYVSCVLLERDIYRGGV